MSLRPLSRRGSNDNPANNDEEISSNNDSPITQKNSTHTTSSNASEKSVQSSPELIEKYRKLLGKERLRSEIRLLGGIMLCLGIGATFSTFNLISFLIDGTLEFESVRGLLLPIVVGNFLQIICGMTGMATGMLALLVAPVSSPRFHTWCKVAVGLINLGPISFVISMIKLIQGASEPPEFQPFIPMDLKPTQTDIRMCVAMGVLNLISVCCTLIGGLTVVGLHLCAILGQQPHSRHKAYHIIRSAYYNFLVLLGGISYLLLGTYLWVRYGRGPYNMPIHVAAYTIHFPSIAVMVGSAQTLMGLFGFLRAIIPSIRGDEKDGSHLWCIVLVWLLSTIFQFLWQPAYGDNALYNAEAATAACVYIGFFAMPALLDYLVRHTPIQPRPEYYGLDKDAFYREDVPTILLRMVPPKSVVVTRTATSNDEEHGTYQEVLVPTVQPYK